MAKRLKCVSDAATPLLNYAKSAGWSVSRSRSQHLKFVKPGRRVFFTSGTPSDNRAYRNALASLRRADREQQEAA